MKKNMICVLFLFLAGNIPSVTYCIPASPWILGSLHYEGYSNNNRVPLYYEGNNIIPSSNKRKTHLDFEIPRSRGDQNYYVLVTEKVISIAKKSVTGELILNTIDYLKVPKGTDYRLYKIHLESEFVINQHGKSEKIYYWEVTEMDLPKNGQIPSQTLIVLDLPERVFSFESGGSLLSWPTICMHTSQKNDPVFMDRLTKIHLSVVDLNTIHIPIKKTVEYLNDNKKIIIAFSS